MTVIGYFGIVVPERNFFQGFFLDDAIRSQGETSLAALRAMSDLQQIVVMEPLLGVAEADQALLGGLCSGAVETALTGDSKVAIFGMGISVIIQTDFFWIRGAESASHTSIHRIAARRVDMARAIFGNLPEVQEIRGRMKP
jgi:hypothetical protein